MNVLAPVVLMAVLVAAVRQDLASNRIPNILSFGALVAGLVLAAISYGLGGVGFALAGTAVAFGCLLPLYLAKGMGAGDVKLMAAAGAFLGPVNAFIAAMLTLATGAVLGFMLLAWRIIGMRNASGALASGFETPQFGKQRFPYAAAIAVGVVATMWLRGLLKPLARSLA